MSANAINSSTALQITELEGCSFIDCVIPRLEVDRRQYIDVDWCKDTGNGKIDTALISGERLFQASILNRTSTSVSHYYRQKLLQ